MRDSVLSQMGMDRWTSPSAEMGRSISSGVFSSGRRCVVLEKPGMAEVRGSASGFASHLQDFFWVTDRWTIFLRSSWVSGSPSYSVIFSWRSRNQREDRSDVRRRHQRSRDARVLTLALKVRDGFRVEEWSQKLSLYLNFVTDTLAALW